MLRVLSPRSHITETRALWHMEALAWSIRTFGAPHLPKIPSVLQRFTPLSETARDAVEVRLPFDWASDLFGRVQMECFMDDWDIRLMQLGTKGIESVSMATTHGSNAPGCYAVNIVGDPVIVADPSTYGQHGQTALDYILQLATMKFASAPAPDHYFANLHAHAVVAMAIYNAQGLELMNMQAALAQKACEVGWIRQADVAGFLAELEYATILAMRVRGLAPEQIVASYGPILSKSQRKRVWSLSAAMDRHDAELKLLRSLASGQMAGANHAQVQLRGAL